MIGRTLAHYKIIEKIGAGGMGEVYRATDTKLGRDVALKILPPDYADDPVRRRRFEQEAKAVASLNHSNIVTIHSIEEEGKIRFLTMELVEGQTLSRLLKDNRPHPERVCDILLSLVDALEAAHGRSLVHCDLKPANVMVSTDGRVKLLDFGVARLRSDTTATSEDATRSMAGTEPVGGTLAYMSPEQLQGRAVDPRSDLFSLGILIYELATGRHPFPGENPAQRLSAILRDDPPPCADLEPATGQALGSILSRCLQKDPDRRYANAGELKQELMALKETLRSSPPASRTEDDLRCRGLAAFERQDWSEAFDLLGRANEANPLAPDDLRRFAEAAWWIGEVTVSRKALESAYAEYVRLGDELEAGSVATELAEHYHGIGSEVVSRGWCQRAERLLEGHRSTLEFGVLNRFRTRIVMDDPKRALELSEVTIRIAREHGHRGLECIGLQDRGRSLIGLGRVEEGLALIDEAMTGVTSGELNLHDTGRLYCNMMTTCDELADYRRAAEWSEAARTWCEPHTDSAYPGICLVHQGEVLHQRGQWEAAEEHIRNACRELADWSAEISAEAHYKIGEIRLQRGDWDGAEESFRKAHELGRDPVPGLPLLRFAQGKTEAASGLLQRALVETKKPLSRARLLPARIEVAVAARDLATADTAVAELGKIAREFHCPAYEAAADQGHGSLLLVKGEAEEAATVLKSAWRTWNDLDLPYQAARARVLLARAYRETGDTEGAELELRAARGVFEKLGAIPDLRAADAL